MELKEIKCIANRIQREIANKTYTSSNVFLTDIEELTRRILNEA
jgi:hypothetical protein